MNRLLAVGWLALLIFSTASYLRSREPDVTTFLAFLAVMAVFAIPSWLLWRSAPGLISGQPSWLRSIVLLETIVVIFGSFGLALVPLIAIFVLAGDGSEA
jgi:hypothetical protein